MASISNMEKEVLLYLKAALAREQLDGVSAREIADNIDARIEDVIAASEKLEETNLGNIRSREVEKDRVKGLVIEITSQGLQYLAKEGLVPK
ncbi:hypothetical protein CUJ83_01820 [Methanocella sp. CWC-04]|uniref:Uncharacterized protein n=1 Tax=Methanooceanicella nereidis TaxID=2052831 RepID=A0AAP2RA47_9EURY|nr:hypothetical protein [Methanocella sp. CWC-04]MCD1293733.1 hypothetical protein [Methanocella sp. CWC-04]